MSRRPLLGALAAVALTLTAACGPIVPLTSSPLRPPDPPFPGLDEAVDDSLGRIAVPTVERISAREGEPTEAFGRRSVVRAYAETVWYATATTFSLNTMWDTPLRGPAQFTRHTSRLTAEAASELRTTAGQCFDGDSDACGMLHAQRFYWTEWDEYELQPRGPLLVDHAIREPYLWMDRSGEEPQLVVRFEQRADVRVRRDGVDLLLPLTKDTSFWLVPAPEGTNHDWQIDFIQADWSQQAPRPDTGSY
jgi:hypothetical protein